jgi:hypothetical protein
LLLLEIIYWEQTEISCARRFLLYGDEMVEHFDQSKRNHVLEVDLMLVLVGEVRRFYFVVVKEGKKPKCKDCIGEYKGGES